MSIGSVGRLAYIIKQVHFSKSIKPGKELSYYNYPTWGDQNLLISAVEYIKPDNEQALLNGLNLEYPASDHSRIVRNASAHLSKFRLLEVERLKIHYQGRVFRHPLDLITWQDKSSQEPAFLVWLEDLREIAESMVQ